MGQCENHRRKVKCYSSSYLILNKFTSTGNCKILTGRYTLLHLWRQINRDGAKRREQREKREGEIEGSSEFY